LAGYPGRALLVSGEADLRFTDVARRMGLLFKHAQIEHVPGSGHRLLLEKPRALAHLVTRFFANTAASGH
jgi:pimeloyl-ACP methyl ester carboxylesterase